MNPRYNYLKLFLGVEHGEAQGPEGLGRGLGSRPRQSSTDNLHLYTGGNFQSVLRIWSIFFYPDQDPRIFLKIRIRIRILLSI